MMQNKIWRQSRELGHVPIIDRNPRKGDAIPMAPHEARRYNERSVAERFNSRLKEEFGGRNVIYNAEINSPIHPQCKMMVLISRYPAKHT
jgi:hypothetical protein